MLDKYFSVLGDGEAEYVEKKSKFFAYCRAVKTEDEAKNFILEIKKKHHSARHCVFAYLLGFDNETKRCSDDGEPSGTAGIPILSILERENLQFTAVVVSRYFGGTLLGTGGLVRAYSSSAKLAIENSVVIEKLLHKKVFLTVEYSLSAKIEYELLSHSFIIGETSYTEQVNFVLYIESARFEIFENLLADLTSAQNELTISEKDVYITQIGKEIIVFE